MDDPAVVGFVPEGGAGGVVGGFEGMDEGGQGGLGGPGFGGDKWEVVAADASIGEVASAVEEAGEVEEGGLGADRADFAIGEEVVIEFGPHGC